MEKTKKILIIEDELSLSNVLYNKLKRENFNIFMAKNGKEGLEIALREHPDIILLDIIMPVMDGITVLNELRKNSWGKSAKVIILTNLSDASSVANVLENNVYDFLVKSDWKLEEVIKKIEEKLNLK